MIVDSHCHLDYMAREGILPDVLARARAAGVGTMLTIGTTIAEFPQVQAIAEAHDDIWCSVGVHPHHAAEEPDTSVEQLVALSRHPKVIAIGECGLDYHYDRSPRDVQRAVFRTHVEAARQSGLPLVVHSRNADADTVEVLAEGAAKGGVRGLIHCFSTTRRLSGPAIDLGFSISLSGIVTFPKSTDLQEIAKELPDENLLVETDAPYLAPVPKRGKKNEPAFVVHTADFLAQLRGTSRERLDAVTSDNFFRLFDKARRPSA
ncbi:MAG: TatD family hydrolase [Dongiaceae bacterium]